MHVLLLQNYKSYGSICGISVIRALRPCRTQDYLTSYQKNIPRKTCQRHILLTLDVDTVRIKDGVPYQVRVIYVLPFLASQMQVGYIVRTTKEGGSAVPGARGGVGGGGAGLCGVWNGR